MARFVMSNRRAGKFHETEKTASRVAAQRAFDTLLSPAAEVVGEWRPTDQTAREVIIFDADPQEVTAKRASMGPDVLVEPEILHYPTVAMPLDVSRSADPNRKDAVLAGAGRRLRITFCGPQGPIPDAEAILVLRGPLGSSTRLERVTDNNGVAEFQYGGSWSAAVMILVPYADYWTMLVRGPQDGQVINAPALSAVDASAWWRRAVGAPLSGGRGIRVGVIDTGLGPHPHLSHAQLNGSFLQSVHDPDPQATYDVDSHGTHVAGTIGARPPGPGVPAAPGIATDCTLAAARVFPSKDDGANQGDIALAIDHLSGVFGADLINLSLGSPQPSQIERDAIVDALERGTLCICAAANSAGPVEFPAAFPEAVAVSAIGLVGWAPQGTLAASRYPDSPDRYGDDGYFHANFSCFGEEIDCAAPGVGIIAAVPARGGGAPLAAMDGTSMASPVACGAVAAFLADSPDYLNLPRNQLRAEKARALLRQHCRDIGLAPVYQGPGVPQVS